MSFPERALALLQQDSRLQRTTAGSSVRFAFVNDTDRMCIRVAEGHVESSEEADFTLSAPDAVWARLISAHPEPGEQHVLPQLRSGTMTLEGDARAFERHLHVVRRAVEALRPRSGASSASRPRRQTLRGEYVRIESSAGSSDVFVERAGCGPQLLCLATAGSDTTQFHGLITDTDIADRFELIAFDLPWHGKSVPPAGVDPLAYSLTPELYTELIIATADALELERPILVGASMGGAAVVRAIALHPERFAGAVSCQAAKDVAGRATPAARATDVDQTLFSPEWTYGLMNPASPQQHRDRVWWGYSSGAHGVYIGDIEGYQQWDFTAVSAKFTPSSPHIAVLSGVYDTSVPPERSEELAASIPNASFERMPQLGHFPHAENPQEFWSHLQPALERVLAHRP
ncbi:alpha/beta hydrolase [uncultured Agrococcus sp.]|uniref:alpha/beta fold hydrolase n=1 Tax=uncultured Agrococcus sp. TaxID=382258 RepID=UPI0025D04329|nr:alpha/beta hydrolase [uncultured Agrococcus sp.]